LSYAIYLLKVMMGINPNKTTVYQLGFFMTKEYIVIMIVAIILATGAGQKIWQKIANKIPALEIVALALWLILSIMQLSGDTYNPFIYFRF